MSGFLGGAEVGRVNVVTSDHGGHSAEYFTDKVIRSAIHIADNANPVIRQQAHAFRDALRTVVGLAINDAMESARRSDIAALDAAGHQAAANFLREFKD